MEEFLHQRLKLGGKMKILFGHDHIFQISNSGKIYTKGGLPSEVWGNYLNEEDTLEVLARSQQNQEIRNLKLSERRNVKFNFIEGLSNVKALFFSDKSSTEIIKEKVKEADLVIVRLPSEIGNKTYDIAKKLNKKIIVEVVACVWDALWNYGKLKSKIYAPIAFLRMKKRVFFSRNTIYVTNETLQKKYPTRGSSIGCSNVNLPYVLEENLSKKLNKEKKSAVKIGLIGNVSNKIKGIDVALKAFNELKKEKIDIVLEILGAGNSDIWKKDIEKYSLKNLVKFKGTLPSGEAVFKWLDNLDIYIQPSYQEGLPRAIIEAMSRGLPIAASNAGGCKELINSDFVHNKGEHLVLAEHLKIIIRDKQIREGEMKNNFENSKKYLKSKLFKRRKDFINNVLKSDL